MLRKIEAAEIVKDLSLRQHYLRSHLLECPVDEAPALRSALMKNRLGHKGLRAANNVLRSSCPSQRWDDLL